jgi:glycosyltransferase involved in cell wall biosynthesis
MKFSLAIPCYNEEKNLPLLLESIDKLNYPRNDFEIIIIDNNSVDKTVEIAKKFGVDKIVKEEKQGLTYARQRGFLSAEGEIICCIDADCQLPVDWLKNASLFFKDLKIIAVSGPYDYFDANPIFRNISLFFQSVFYPLVPKTLNLFLKNQPL